MIRSRYTLVASVGLLGAWIGGCTRSNVLPPTAAIASPMTAPAPSIAAVPAPVPPPTSVAKIVPPPASIPTPPTAVNPWKTESAAREWKYIVIHHTATSAGSVESIHEAHLQKKDASGKPWLGIGYHFVIGNGNGMADGAVEPTFRWKQQMHGAHAGSSNKDHNQIGIGVCLVGNFEETSPTEAQRRSVKELVQTLKTEYRISSSNVIGHRDIKTTECPGKLFPMSEVAAAGDRIDTLQSQQAPAAPLRIAALPRGTHP